MARSLQKSRPTQKDIARALGISQAAVAMALNAKTQWKLTPETVALVQAKATEMNYTPQRQASILRSGRSHTIGVAFFYGVYFAVQERVRRLAQEAIRAGYQLVAVDVGWFEGDMQQAADYLKGAAVEGVILCNFSSDMVEKWDWNAHDWPTLCLNTPSVPGSDSIACDMAEAFRDVTAHHLAQGSRNLTFLAGYYDPALLSHLGVSASINERIRGFTRAMTEAGGEVIAARPEDSTLLGLPGAFRRQGNIPRGRVMYAPRSPRVTDAFEHGAYWMNYWIESGGELPDSLVCTNDDIAISALGVCIKRGISVPRDLLISGADDSPFGRHAGIPLTTLKQPPEEQAKFSIGRLVNVIENRELMREPVHYRFPCELIIRDSTLRCS